MRILHLNGLLWANLLAASAPDGAKAWTPQSSSRSNPQTQVSDPVTVPAESTVTSSRRSFVTQSLVASSAAVMTASGILSTPTAPAVAASTPETTAATSSSSSSNNVLSSLVAPNSLLGKVIVITGATTGIGLESAKALAQGGATVVMTTRTAAKGPAALDTVQSYLQSQGLQNSRVYTVQLDLDNLANVKSFPQRLQSTLAANSDDTTMPKIDVLMNNAGVMAIPDLQYTQDGYERTFQSNHLGHFALTAKLAPYLQEKARIINVSSLAYSFASSGLDLDNLNGEKKYGPWSSYGQSKLENILFTQELQRRVDQAGLEWTVTSLHPGAVNTDLARNMMGGDEAWYAKKASGPTTFFEKLADATIQKALLTPEQGAVTQVYLAVADNDKVPKGQFFNDQKVQSLPAFATDVQKAQTLWQKSEELAGVTFQVAAPTTSSTTTVTTATTSP